MCDTLTALSSATARGAALFAKNSDRERNEAQVLEVHPPRPAGGDLKATYISVPDEGAAHACLISRPFWMWGAEMGANSQGVVIGNEALHAKTPAQRRRALIGMDLLRLGLERGGSAAEALQVIITLLERHGQGGDCGHLGRFYYQNGFIIADPSEAFVLETVGREWVVQRVKDRRALSNAYSIGADFDAISPGLQAQGPGQGAFDVAAHLIDANRDAISFGRGRCARGQTLLNAAPALTPSAMMAILRDHGEAPDWSPANTQGRTICMHAAEGARRSQSVASMVSELAGERAVHWVTGTSAPCLSLFKPVILGVGPTDFGAKPTDHRDTESLWWRHEHFHRGALKDFHDVHTAIAAERDAIEADFQDRVYRRPDAKTLADCWREAAEVEARWAAALVPARWPATSYGRSWARLDQAAG